jgi:hypothetical protein
MADGMHCPECGKDIGVWPIFSAGLPSRIWCPHCHSRLRYRNTTGVLLLILLVLVGVLAGAYFTASALPTSQTIGLVIFGVIALGAWVPVELVVTWFLRNYRELECIGSQHSPSKN